MPEDLNGAWGDMMAARLRQSHEEAVQRYERDCRRNAVFFRRNYGPLLPEGRDGRLLEIGCGMGHFLHFCRQSGYEHAKGIDLSPLNVSFCRDKGFDVEEAEASAFLAAHEDAFDAIMMNDVIEHIPKDAILELLARIRKALRPGGVFIAKTINMAHPVLGAHSRYNDFSHTVGWTEESMRQVLEHSGFEAQVLPSRLYVYYSNPLNYVGMAFERTFEAMLYAIYILNGRHTTRVFTKNLIGVGRKT